MSVHNTVGDEDEGKVQGPSRSLTRRQIYRSSVPAFHRSTAAVAIAGLGDGDRKMDKSESSQVGEILYVKSKD